MWLINCRFLIDFSIKSGEATLVDLKILAFIFLDSFELYEMHVITENFIFSHFDAKQRN